MLKIKVFLAAFTNQTNAQNLSCRALAKYLDKDKFEVYTLQIKHGNLKSQRIEGVKVFNCRFPVKITGVLGLIWGFFHADVVYLPRGIFLKWQIFLTKVFKVRSFKTVRNIIDDDALKSAMSQLVGPTNGELKSAYNFVDKVYSMTSYMSSYNEKRWGIISENITLLPPSDIRAFNDTARVREVLKNVIFIGNDWERKGLIEYLALAKSFPTLKFHVVGQGDEQKYRRISPKNVQYHGMLTDDELIDLIQKSDLHILPSKSEGLPRVFIETMANGLPSILFYGYGAEEFIQNGSNGFISNNILETEDILRQLISNEISLKTLSQGCFESSIRFDPITLTHKYEQVISELYAS